jgi:hypothetical protein
VRCRGCGAKSLIGKDFSRLSTDSVDNFVNKLRKQPSKPCHTRLGNRLLGHAAAPEFLQINDLAHSFVVLHVPLQKSITPDPLRAHWG